MYNICIYNIHKAFTSTCSQPEDFQFSANGKNSRRNHAKLFMSKEPRQALQSRERNHAPISWSFKVDMSPKHLARQQAAVTKMTHQPIQRICRNSVETWIMRFLIAEIMWLCLVKRTGATKVRLYSFLTSRPVMTVRPPRRPIARRRFAMGHRICALMPVHCANAS